MSLVHQEDLIISPVFVPVFKDFYFFTSCVIYEAVSYVTFKVLI